MLRKCYKIILLLVIILNQSSATFIKYSKLVSSDNTFLFFWSIDEANGLIKFEFDVKTLGWIGVGISPNGLMLNSDMYLTYIQKDGQVLVSDRFAIKSRTPELDTALGTTYICDI